MFFFIVRLILAFLLYIIAFILLQIVPQSWKLSIFNWCSVIFLKVCNFNQFCCSEIQAKRLNDLVDSDLKFIVVFNHASLYDGPILKTMFNKLSFVVSDKLGKLVPFLNSFYESLDLFLVKSGGSKTQGAANQILQKSLKRKPGEHVIAISPDEMYQPIPPGCNISPFKTGAFIGMLPILPVIIRYTDCKIYPDYRYDIGEHPVHSLTKKFLEPCNVEVDILDLVYPDKHSSICQYRDKVHAIMEARYEQLEKKQN
jgi:1-acyl-sn-glycerol-3-phosphate acyltransferase